MPDNKDALAGLVLQHLEQLLFSPSVPAIPPELAECESLRAVHEKLSELREILIAFSQGDLSSNITMKGFTPGALKALQAHLRHMTWQVQQVASGDFTQRVDFLGDFSIAFNSMVVQLDNTLTALREQEAGLIALTKSLHEEVEVRKKAVAALRQSEAKFRYLAERDSLTGVFNRRSFLELALEKLQTAAIAGTPCCIAVLDVDFFKKFNDTYGHLDGDKALKHVVSQAEASLRHADIMGRYGGEEFIFLFTDANIDQGKTVAERIRNAIKDRPVPLENASPVITVSIGVAVVLPEWEAPRDYFFLQQITHLADMALYAAKETRNTVKTADPCEPRRNSDEDEAGGGDSKSKKDAGTLQPVFPR